LPSTSPDTVKGDNDSIDDNMRIITINPEWDRMVIINVILVFVAKIGILVCRV
jgi:hypothetical protein